jgi:hydroxybutyrate-dimer hydrolase
MTSTKPRTMRRRLMAVAVTIAAIHAASPSAAADQAEGAKPSWLRSVQKTVFDGRADDLVTGGLGASGLVGNAGPDDYADKLDPTAAELRRAVLTKRQNSGEGFSRLFGPNVDPATGEVLADDGRFAGEEHLAYADDGEGRQNVAMLLQIPAGLNRTKPCILAVPLSGSNGLYRNVVDLGYWGLRKGCAVAYTDKGNGNGFHDLEADTVTLLDGTRASTASAGKEAHFAADLSDGERAAFLERHPHRLAFKHAHSKQNPEST